MIGDVIVHVDSTRGGKARLDYAFELGSHFGARVTGIHVLAPVDVPPYFKPHAIEHVAQNAAQSARRDAKASEELFAEKACSQATPSRWLGLEGHMSDRLCEQARYADLVVLGQYEAEGAPHRRPLYLAEEVVLGAGRPVLVVPEAWDCGFRCERALIGWDASREAARAVHDAIPLLAGARVTILWLEEHGRSAPIAELTDHLTRHGLSVETSSLAHAHMSHGSALIAQLEAGAFDLLVIGAYGHSVWLELLVGGDTRSVLAHTPTPVMISH